MIRIICLSAAIAVGGVVVSGQPVLAQEVQVAPSPALAEEAPALHRMLESMGVYEVIALMSTENTRGSADIEAQLFPEAGGAAWAAMATRLNAADRMVALFEQALDRAALSDAQIAQTQAFLDSGAGQGIIAGELGARRMFLDDAAVDAAKEALRVAVADNDPRLEILRRFSDVNGLVDRNVTGALNLRFAFYRALIEGGAFEGDMPEGLMLSEVWAQEPEVRQQTVEWLFSFQLTAYADVSDADMEAYIAFSDTPTGRAVNGALFAAFDEMLATMSYDLGAAAAIFVAGEDA